MLILFLAQAFKKPVEKDKEKDKKDKEPDLSNLSKEHIESWIKFTNQLGYLGININEMKPEEIEKRMREINKYGIFVLSGRDVQNLQEIFKMFGYEFKAEVLPKDSYLATKFEEFKQQYPNIDDAIREFVKYANSPSTQKIGLEIKIPPVEKTVTDKSSESDGNETINIVKADLNKIDKTVQIINDEISKWKSKYNIGASTGTVSQSSTPMDIKSEGAKEQKEIKGEVKPEERSKLISAIENLKSIKIQTGQNKDKTPITKELGNLDKAAPKIKKLEEGTFSEGESISFNMKENTEMMSILKEIAKYRAGAEVEEKQVSDNDFLYFGKSSDGKPIGYGVKYEKGSYVYRRITQNEILKYTSASVTKQKEENNEERKIEPISFKDTPITIESKTITFRAKTLDRAYKGENFVINPDALQFNKNVSIQAKQNIADKFAEELSNKIASMGLKASIKYIKRTEQGDTWKLIIEKTQ